LAFPAIINRSGDAFVFQYTVIILLKWFLAVTHLGATARCSDILNDRQIVISWRLR